MTGKSPGKSRTTLPLRFFRGFLKHPLAVSSVVPSSRFLERRLVSIGEVGSATTLIELGPGTGGTTAAVLAAMPEEATLLCLEIDPDFVRVLRERFDDTRLIIEHGDAVDLPEKLSQHGLPAPDLVFSGIPFSTMDRVLGDRIVAAIESCLAPGGRFVAYQFSDRVARLMTDYLGPPDVRLEWLNLPPMRFFSWRKPLPVEAAGTSVEVEGPE